MKTVLLAVTHLLGVGHVFRARKIAEAMRARGIAVHIAHGGMPLADAAPQTTHLAPIRATDATYATLVTGDGDPLDDAWKDRRAADLIDLYDRIRPDAILLEAWPFGRRALTRETLALLDHNGGRSQVWTSVRDILQENRKPGRAEETRDLVMNRIDRVLVHSDPALVPLDATFPLTPAIADRLHYTGFVAPPLVEAQVPAFDVIVTAGGGAFGAELLGAAALVAARHPDERWCIATGPNGTPPADVPSNVEIVERLDGLAAHLARAGLSISQAGYNTSMDVLAADVPAVLVPHDTTGQTEQSRRAALFEQAGYAVALPQSALTPETLQAAISRARAMPRPTHRPALDGADRTAALAVEWLATP